MRQIYILGSLNMDLVINAPMMPKKGETLTGNSFMMNPGGKGANQAVAVSLSGGNAHMIGAVGNTFGKDLLHALKKYHVDSQRVYELPDEPSGTAMIIISEGDNRIILDPGANHCINETMIDQALASAHPGDFLLTQLEIPVPMVSYAFKKAKALGMKTFLNAAPAKELPDGLFKLTDYFFPNQNETQFYTGVYPDGPEAASRAARAIIDKGVRHVLITMGAEGSLFYNPQECLGVKSFRVQVVDTTAAGDTFIGAFLTYLAEDKNIFEAMDFASAASALCITKKGAQQSIPSRKQTEEFQRSGICKRK